MTELEDLEDDSSDESVSEAAPDMDVAGNEENQDMSNVILPKKASAIGMAVLRPEAAKPGHRKWGPYSCSRSLRGS